MHLLHDPPPLQELEEQGVEIIKTDNGEDAIRLIQEQRPQLVFLDVMIPKINGFEVCRIVKRELQMEDIMIVILTAKGQEYDYHTGQEVGANLYMTKPFDPDALLELAAKVFLNDDPNYLKRCSRSKTTCRRAPGKNAAETPRSGSLAKPRARGS